MSLNRDIAEAPSSFRQSEPGQAPVALVMKQIKETRAEPPFGVDVGLDAGQDLARVALDVRRCSRQCVGPCPRGWRAGCLSLGLLAAAGEFGSERGLLVEDSVAVASAGNQPCVMQDGQMLGDGTGSKFVPPCQGVGGGWFGE